MLEQLPEERRNLFPRGSAQKSERRDTCEGAGGGREVGSDSRGRGGGKRPTAAVRGGAAPGRDPGAQGEHLAGIPERGGAPGLGAAAWKAAQPGRGWGQKEQSAPVPHSPAPSLRHPRRAP